MSSVQLVENGHLWKAEEFHPHEVDEWVWDHDYHSGPICNECYECPCVNCEPDWGKGKCFIFDEPSLFPLDDLGDIYQAWKENND